MARKIPGLQRVLDAPALFSVAYGEIASSIYVALGIIVVHALGLAPEVLLARRRALPGRLALLRRGHGRDPGDGRRRHLRPPRVQRPRRLPDRLGALPRLPDRDRPLGALPAALPRGGVQGRRAQRRPVGAGRRRRRDRGRRRLPARPPLGLLPLRDRRRGPRPRHAGRPRRARLRAPLLQRRAHARDLDRERALLAPDRLRAAAGDARLHGPRDRREPGRGDARARARPPAQPVRRDRARRRHLRGDRARRALGVPGEGRPDRARRRPGCARR